MTIAGVAGSLVAGGYDGTFTVTSVIGTSGSQTGFTYALTTNPGTATLSGATAAAAARSYSVLFNTAMDAVTLTTGNSDSDISMVHDPDVASLTIDTGNGTNVINLLDVPAPGQTAAAQTIDVNTGTGTDQASVYAGQSNHTYNVNLGQSTGNTGTGDVLVLDGNPTNDAHDTFTGVLGGANDTAQVAGADLFSSDTVHLDGGPGVNTLLYNSAGNPINPSTLLTPNGTVTLVSPTVATVVYKNFQSIPGFVGPTANGGGSYTITEGSSLTLSGSATAATGAQLLGISWDLNGDGVYGDAVDTSVTFPAMSATSKPTVTWAQLEALGLTLAGDYTIGMQVTTTGGTFYSYATLIVNTVPPVVTVSAPSTAKVGEPYSVTFSSAFPGGEVPTGWSVDWGDGTSTTLPSDATTATHVYTAVGTDTVTASVTDAAGTYTSTGQTVTVGQDTSTSSVSAGGPYTINAGNSLTLTATADGAPTTALWDLKGLGTYTGGSASFVSNGDGTSTSTLTLTWAQLAVDGITDSGVFASVSVQAVYPTTVVPAGFLNSTKTTLTINDVVPTATLSGTALEGGAGSVTFSNQASPVQTSGFLYSYDVGNTGSFQTTNSPSPTFTIPTNDLLQSGSLVVRGRITDKHGLFTDSIITFPITNQPPTILTIDGNKTLNAASAVALTNVTFSDPGQEIVTSSINWGDGTTTPGVVTTTNSNPAPTTGTVSASHPFAFSATPYTVTVTIMDSGGGTASRQFMVTVQNPPLSVTAGTNQSISEGGQVNLTGATFTDPGAPNTYTATVNWGDGTIDTNPIITPPASPSDQGQVLDNHDYGHAGVYTVTVSVTKPNASPVSSNFTVTVNNVVPTVNAGADVPAGLGVPVNVNASFSDPGFPVGSTKETFTATINWGDNSSSPGTVTVTPGSAGVPTTGTVTGSHQYSGDGPYTVAVSVGDGTVVGNDTFQVTDAPAVVSPSVSTLSANEGSPVNLNATFTDLGFTHGGTTRSFTALINWGDNTTSPGVVTVTQGNATTPTTGTIAATHTYTTFSATPTGTFPITIQLTDEGGVTGTATVNATVKNLAPSVATLPGGSFVLSTPSSFYPNDPAAQEANPGQPFILTGSFTDPGVGDTHTVSINWGDGTTTVYDANSHFADLSGNPVAGLVEPTATMPGTYSLGHVYYSDATDDRPKTITVTITDNGGLSSETTEVLQPQAQNQPSFSALSAPTITYGTATTTVSGTLNSNVGGQFVPSTESVSVSLNGVTQTAALDSNDHFSTTFDTHALNVVAGGYTIDFIYGGDSNFSAASATDSLTVNPAALTITANSTSKIYGTLETFSTTTFSQAAALVTAKWRHGLGAVTETSTGAPTSSTVGTYPIVPGAATGTGLGNYTIAYVNGTLTVNAATLTITANSTTKSYGTLEMFSTTTFSQSGLVTANGDTISGVTETSTGSPVSATVGTYPIVPGAATGMGLSNYAIAYVNGTLTVNPATLTITANSTSKTYGTQETFSTTTFSQSGLVTANGDSITSVTETSTGSPVSATIGSYPIVPNAATGTGLSNYTIAYVNGTLTVNPATLTITANSTSKTFGTSETFGTDAFTQSGLVTANGDTITSVTETSTGAPATATVGSYSIVPSAATGTGLANYTIDYVDGTLTVNPATVTLTITADAESKTYGTLETFSSTAFMENGLVNGDTITSVTETSAGASVSANVGTYAIVPSAAIGTGLSNYTIGSCERQR